MIMTSLRGQKGADELPKDSWTLNVADVTSCETISIYTL